MTKIELLSITVILAVIAVITVPIVLNIIKNSKKGSIKVSALGYKDFISRYYFTGLPNELKSEKKNCMDAVTIYARQLRYNPPDDSEITNVQGTINNLYLKLRGNWTTQKLDK